MEILNTLDTQNAKLPKVVCDGLWVVLILTYKERTCLGCPQSTDSVSSAQFAG